MSKKVEKMLTEMESKIREIKERSDYFIKKPTVCAVGQISVGKSSFLNLLLGENLFQSSTGETTKNITKVTKEKLKGNNDLLELINIADIPGYNKSFNKEVEDYLKNGDYDIVLYILDISKGITKIDAELLNIVKARNPFILFVLNKIDMYEGEDRESFERLIHSIRQTVEKIYHKNKILGYVPASAKKFKNKKILVEFLKNIIVIASYVSTFKTNLNTKRGEFNNYLDTYINSVKYSYNYFVESYLRKLRSRLDETSNTDIILDGEKVIKRLVDELNSELKEDVNYKVYTIFEHLNGKIYEVQEFIKNMSISYIKVLDIDLGQNYRTFQGLNISNIDIQHASYSDEAFEKVMLNILTSFGAGLLARLALGALIPGIGTLVFIGSLIWAFIDAGNKANEVRNKVYDEISSKLPSILKNSWNDMLNEIETNYKKQILEITDNPEINNFLDDLIFATYNMNDNFSNVIIEEFTY